MYDNSGDLSLSALRLPFHPAFRTAETRGPYPFPVLPFSSSLSAVPPPVLFAALAAAQVRNVIFASGFRPSTLHYRPG